MQYWLSPVLVSVPRATLTTATHEREDAHSMPGHRAQPAPTEREHGLRERVVDWTSTKPVDADGS